MIIVINDKEISINTIRDLISAVSALNEDDADTVMLKLLSDPAAFKSVFENCPDFRSALKELPERQAARLLQHVLQNSDEFNRIFANNYLLETMITTIPDKFAEKIMSYVFYYPLQFQRLYDGEIAFTTATNRLPEKYAQQLVTIVLQQPQELLRLIKNKYSFESLAKDLPEIYRAGIIRKIINNPDHLAIVADDLEAIKLYLNILPAGIASELVNNLCENRALLHAVFNNSYHLQKIVKEFPEQYARRLIKAYDSFNRESALHVAARSKPELVSDLVKFGSRPLTGKETEDNTLYYLLGQKTCPIECIASVIEQGANPLTVSRDNNSSLHKAAESTSAAANKYVPVLIQLGVDVNARNYHSQTALDILLAKPNFTELDIDPALALIQHSGEAAEMSLAKKNILHTIYQHHPQIQDYVARQTGKNNILNPAEVFAKVNIASLRLKIQSLSSVHQARRNYVNFLIWLVYHRGHNDNKSFFKTASQDLLLRIISFLDFAAMGEKTAQQGLALANHVFSQAAVIKALTHTPGGISVLQTRNANNELQMTLFQSVKTLCNDYEEYKEYLQRTQHRRHPVYDKVTKKEFTNTSLQQLEDFRRKHATGYLRKHLSLFQTKEPKLALTEVIEQTELFNPRQPEKK